MAWDEDLLSEQKIAASHFGKHARLLAGPGTEKTLTLTRHICYLITEKNISPQMILAVTFTRAAARELRQRVESELGKEQCPRISTIHSFALRQLLRNASRISDLPQPLRIADDWEERNIILEDIKSMLGLGRIDDARDLLNDLSADWQSLTVDESDWERRFPNPEFLGVWREHRGIYGYTLRSELVYQLKKVLEQRGDFDLEGPIGYLLVDEYQDLNRCDLSVVREISSRNVELYIAGDDDQSIYGFRKAHPEGIRRFPKEFIGTQELTLEICKRCDKDILNIGLFVAQQDNRRERKIITPEPGKSRGEVGLLRFGEQDTEAIGIATLCSHLINDHKVNPENILILLRSDRNNVFSDPIRERLKALKIPVSTATDKLKMLDQNHGRIFLAFIRLAVSREDSMSWRTLFRLWCDGMGPSAITALYDIGRRDGLNFAQTVLAAHNDAAILPSNHQSRISGAIQKTLYKLEEMFPKISQEDCQSCSDLLNTIRTASQKLLANEEERKAVISEIVRIADAAQATSIEELIRAIEVASEDIEQELEEGKVNILTMHRAKGLTAEAVIVAAAEDQYVPGKTQGDAADDERRLLYVSLTRAKHYLFVTYCDGRIGRQIRTGRPAGYDSKTGKPIFTQMRSLTRFLRDAPVIPKDARTFLNNLRRSSL